MYVCVCVCSHHNSDTNEVRMLKLGTDIHTFEFWSWYVLEVNRSMVKVTGSISAKKHVSHHNFVTVHHGAHIGQIKDVQ